MSTPDSNQRMTDTGRRGTSESLPGPATRSVADSISTVGARVKLWPAYCLAVLCPGAGHLYVRQWTRGLSWGLLYGIALVFLSSGALLLDGSVVEPFVLSALRLEEIAFGDVAFPLAILVLNAVDLYTLVVLDRAG